MDRFTRAIHALLRSGATPDARALISSGGTYSPPTAYSWHQLGASCLAGIVLAAIVGVGWMTSRGLSIVTSRDRAILEAIKATQIDLNRISMDDIAARLSIPADDAKAVLAASDRQLGPVMTALGDWLLTVRPDQRRPSLDALMYIVHSEHSDPRLLPITLGLTRLNANTIETLFDALNQKPNFFDRLSLLSKRDRSSVIEMNFPVRARDAARAELWELVNDDRFPAEDLLKPLADIARTDRERFHYIAMYAVGRDPLPACKPVARSKGYVCPAGSHLPEHVTCIYD